jgi:REP element-mobilizing transposase RayT
MFEGLYFFTATILNWMTLLDTEERKMIITDSLRFLVSDKRVKVYGFVIMPNHFHVLWSVNKTYTLEAIQRDMLKFTAQKLKFNLLDANDTRLEKLRSTQADRVFQIWERRPKWKEMMNREMTTQKLNYIHANPLQGKWSLADTAIDYRFSSAAFYETGIDSWGFIAHIHEVM